jgi:hypothetical protein
MKKKTTSKRTSPHRESWDEFEARLRSIKKAPPQRKRLAKIAEAKTMRDKLLLAHYGMTEAEYHAPEMRIARLFFDTRRVDTGELEQRIKRELATGKEVSVRTETEFTTLKSAEKQLYHFAWTAARKWQPEMFLRLARAMQRIARHKFPDNHDGWRRAYLIGCKGNVADAVKCIHWLCDPDLERDKLNRLKRTLFPKDS